MNWLLIIQKDNDAAKDLCETNGMTLFSFLNPSKEEMDILLPELRSLMGKRGNIIYPTEIQKYESIQRQEGNCLDSKYCIELKLLIPRISKMELDHAHPSAILFAHL